MLYSVFLLVLIIGFVCLFVLERRKSLWLILALLQLLHGWEMASVWLEAFIILHLLRCQAATKIDFESATWTVILTTSSLSWSWYETGYFYSLPVFHSSLTWMHSPCVNNKAFVLTFVSSPHKAQTNKENKKHTKCIQMGESPWWCESYRSHQWTVTCETICVVQRQFSNVNVC